MTTKLYRYLRIPKPEESDICARMEILLAENRIGLSSPLDFNDPFDCNAMFTFNGSEDDDFRNFFKGKIAFENPGLTPDEIDRRADEFISTGRHREPELRVKQRELWADAAKGQMENLGMICLSENADSILMWSHYAGNHSGVCLEFDRAELIGGRGDFCEPVTYRTEYPTFSEFVRLEKGKQADFLVMQKAKVWEYEREWRFIAHTEHGVEEIRTKVHPLPKNALSAIILGCQTRAEDETTIRNWLSERTDLPPLKLYRAVQKNAEFGIDICPIE